MAFRLKYVKGIIPEEGYGRCNFMANGVPQADLQRLFEAMALRFEEPTEIVGEN